MIKGEYVILREKRLEDAAQDYAWRTDEELATLDATTPVRLSFSEYLRLYKDELQYPSPWSKRFAIEIHDGKLIGNCMYYDIDSVKGQAELGVMIGDKNYWSQGYGTDAVSTLVDHIFTTTSLKRIYLHTLTWNVRAQRSFQKSGFLAVKEVRRNRHDFIFMDLVRESWEEWKRGVATEGQRKD